MPTFGAPAYLAAATFAAAGVVALHLLAWRRPTPTPFPTARFVPDAPVRAVSRDLRLTDAVLLALRVLALLAAGLAMAEPRLGRTPSGRARVILADRSRAVASVTELRDSVRALGEGVDAVRLVWFDSAAAPTSAVGDTTILSRVDRRGSLSAGLVVALREAQRLARDYADVGIALVSPVAREEVDAASAGVRRLWPHAIQLARLRSRPNDVLPAAPPPRIPPTFDPIGAATQLALATSPASTPRAAALRVVRGGASPDDSAAARAGALLVVWPDSIGAPVAAAPRARAISTGGHAAIAPLLRSPDVPAGRPVARWDDGIVAAAEQRIGAGCVRRVGFLPPSAGDAPLRPAFVELVADLLSPCGDGDWRAVPASELGWLLSAPPSSAPATRAPGAPTREASSPVVVRSLLLIALLALLAEWWLRSQRAGAAVRANVSVSRSREAA